MRSTDTADQSVLRAVVRRFCADKAPSAEARRLMEAPRGHAPAVWERLAGQLGLLGWGIPDRSGASGGGIGAVALAEAGGARPPLPFSDLRVGTQSPTS